MIVFIKQVMGNPSEIPMLLDEMMLDGTLSESGILNTLGEFGGIAREGAMLGMQLKYLSTPINLNGYKNAARMGNLYAYSYNADPLANNRRRSGPISVTMANYRRRNIGPNICGGSSAAYSPGWAHQAPMPKLKRSTLL